MGHAPRVRRGLRAATFVLGARDAVLRPDLHGHADNVVSLLAEKITRHAGIDAAAHAEQNPFFAGAHFARNVMALRRRVNGGPTGALTNGLPASVNRQGNSFERLIPIRGSVTTRSSDSFRG